MRKLLFIPFEACLDDYFEPKGDRFIKAKKQIAFAIENNWRTYLIRSSEWAQEVPWPDPENARYNLKQNRWGIGQDSVKDVRNQLADIMEKLQPPGNPVMRGLFCPNQRSDLPTEMYQIKFNYRATRSDTHFSYQPAWTAMANDGPGNNSYRIPSAGMVRTILKFHKDKDHRIACVYHAEPDRVAANMIGVPLYSSSEWLSGVDPYERSKVVLNKSVSIWSWEYPQRQFRHNNDEHWDTNQRPSIETAG
jgi:hypothetical protein